MRSLRLQAGEERDRLRAEELRRVHRGRPGSGEAHRRRAVPRPHHRGAAGGRRQRRDRVGVARLGSPRAGLRQHEGELRRRRGPSGARRPELPGPRIGRPRLEPHELHRLQRGAGSDRHQREHLQRVVDHRSQHDDRGSGGPHGRPSRQGRRHPVPLGQPAGVRPRLLPR